MKQLLELLLSECLKRDFKTKCSDGQMRYTGICMISEDMRDESIISVEDFYKIKECIHKYKPEVTVNDGYWFSNNDDRVEFITEILTNFE